MINIKYRNVNFNNKIARNLSIITICKPLLLPLEVHMKKIMMMLIYMMLFCIFQIEKSEKQSSANDKHITVTVNMPKTLPILGYVLQASYAHSNIADLTRFKERTIEKQRDYITRWKEFCLKIRQLKKKC